MPWTHQARLAADRALDAAHRAVDRHPALERWQRLRYYRRASRYGHAVAFDTGRGVRYFVRPDDGVIGRAIIRDGAFDLHKIHNTLGLLAEHGFVVEQLVDVGANIGSTTVEILHQLPNARAVALEPEPRNFELLRHNLIANDLESRVDSYRLAASDAATTLHLGLSNENPGDHRIVAGDDGAFGEAAWRSVSVSAIRLDDLLADGRVDGDGSTLLSVDVQGHEAQVLDGAPLLLATRPALLVEVWPYALDRAAGRDRLIAHLQTYGRLFDVTSTPHEIDGAALPVIASRLTGPVASMDVLALA